MKEDLWLKKIKERLDNYAENLPADGWKRLEQALEEMDGVGVGRRKQARIVSLRRWSVAAAATLLIGVSTVSLWLLPQPSQMGPAAERAGGRGDCTLGADAGAGCRAKCPNSSPY